MLTKLATQSPIIWNACECHHTQYHLPDLLHMMHSTHVFGYNQSPGKDKDI